MRRMMALISALVALSGAVSAQTATPTPSPTRTPTATPTTHPNALFEGHYEFESLSAPTISLSGAWSIEVRNSEVTWLRTSTVGNSVSFVVQGKWLVIWRAVEDNTPGTHAMQVCIDAVCRSVSNAWNNAMSGHYVPVAFDMGTYGQRTVTISNTAGILRLDRLWVMQGYVAPVGAAGSTPAPAPSPYVMVVPAIATANPGTNSLDDPVVWATLPPPSGTPSGQMTRFEYAATAGDVHIANLLTMILLSMWAMFLIWLLAIWRRK